MVQRAFTKTEPARRAGKLTGTERSGYPEMVTAKIWLRMCGVLLLAAIGADLSSQHCDLATLTSPVAASVTASLDAPADPCAPLCVPDCFCCSRTEPGSGVGLVLRPDDVAVRVVESPDCPAPGIRPVPYPPPLARA